MATKWDELFTTGIGAVRDVLVARESNDPTPNNRGANDVTAPAGTPATLGVSVPAGMGSVLLLAGVALVAYLLIKR